VHSCKLTDEMAKIYAATATPKTTEKVATTKPETAGTPDTSAVVGGLLVGLVAGVGFAAVGEMAVVGATAEVGVTAAVGLTAVGSAAAVGGEIVVGEVAAVGEAAVVGEVAAVGEAAVVGEVTVVGEAAVVGEVAAVGEAAAVGEVAAVGGDVGAVGRLVGTAVGEVVGAPGTTLPTLATTDSDAWPKSLLQEYARMCTSSPTAVMVRSFCVCKSPHWFKSL